MDAINRLRPGAAGITPPGGTPASQPGAADEFAGLLRRELERVSSLQQEADRSVEQLMTGGDASITDVFTAARKAQVAFSLLMEIRNKLSDAYTEIKQLRV
ncbi:MAG: flagellar hook-basal body complex protein FliE [Planctomycetia bacterium]|nr:MAG: flagellar hook-basal body complex protein FliE [Planctomycetia bacterium]